MGRDLLNCHIVVIQSVQKKPSLSPNQLKPCHSCDIIKICLKDVFSNSKSISINFDWKKTPIDYYVESPIHNVNLLLKKCRFFLNVNWVYGLNTITKTKSEAENNDWTNKHKRSEWNGTYINVPSHRPWAWAMITSMVISSVYLFSVWIRIDAIHLNGK